MNNTFCLSIFMALVFFKHLAWEFSAETIAILLIQMAMAFISLKSTQTLLHVALVLALYPLSIAFVALTEAAGLN